MSLKRHLDSLVANQDRAARVAADPVSFVHRYSDPADQEVVGLMAGLLAFGQVTSIRRSVAGALDRLQGLPAEAITMGEKALQRRFKGFVHRVWRGEHVARLLHRASRLREAEGSLGQALAARLEGETFKEGVARFADELRGRTVSRNMKHLVPDPRAGSACKRLLLYLRWMVRPADGVDVGLWNVSPSLLVIPVDTHIHRISRNLGLTERKDASWRTAEEITAALRRLDPADPVKYDFALCHLGVSRECPSRRDAEKCDGCVLRPVCRVW